MHKPKVVAITGAGISAESGLATFRDSGGLWEGYDIQEVATPQAWEKDPERVLEFYNMRRSQAAKAEPNAAHRKLAEIEEHFNVVTITQNVDDLHERAGSTQVLHLHGELRKARSEVDPDQIVDIGSQKITLGDKAPDGAQLRPHVVWFGEAVPMIEEAAMQVSEADILLVIGTSLLVYPAAGLINYANHGIAKYIVDPSTPSLFDQDDWVHFKENASTGVEKVTDLIYKDYIA